MTESEKLVIIARKLKALSSLLQSDDLSAESYRPLRRELPVVLRNIASEIAEAWDQPEKHPYLLGKLRQTGETTEA